MAEIQSYPFIRHLRAEANAHILLYRGGALRRSERAAAFWFYPLSDSIAEVPVEDRELSLIIHGRSADFQDVTIQGVVMYRLANPERVAERFDFTVDSRTGVALKMPFEKIALMLSQLSQQLASDYISRAPIREILTLGQTQIRERLVAGLRSDADLQAMGLEITSVRVSSVKPSADLEKALEAPVRERIKQQADEAAYERRALAVEKERAIAENELQNRIELAKREELLIEQQSENSRRQAEQDAERSHIAGSAQAEAIATVDGAKAAIERERFATYSATPAAILTAVAARDLAGKIERIDHLNISPELLGPLLANLVEAGTKKLQA
jgi:regulator of protease activity HflC (stomatin/prohibitin superfamily)